LLGLQLLFCKKHLLFISLNLLNNNLFVTFESDTL